MDAKEISESDYFEFTEKRNSTKFDFLRNTKCKNPKTDTEAYTN